MVIKPTLPKSLIAQGRMVDGPGSDLVPKKNLGPGWEFFILTQKQIDDRLKRHVEKHRGKQRKKKHSLVERTQWAAER